MSLRHLQNISPYMHYKTIVLLFIVFSITCTFNMFSPIYAQQQQQGVNWLEICRNPMIDALITEPCESLTSPDGYTLTPQGEHALACIGGGALTLLISQPELLALRDAVGCGGNSGSNSSSSTTTPSDQTGGSSISSSPDSIQQSDQSGDNSSASISSPQSTQYGESSSSCATITQDCPSNISSSSVKVHQLYLMEHPLYHQIKQYLLYLLKMKLINL